jgi:hypothetical protein
VDYVYVNSTGTVTGYPRPLPVSFNNISNFHVLPPDRLRENGWYPVRFVPHPDKTENSIVTGQTFVIEGNEVVQYEQIREKTQEELQQEIDNQWENIRGERNSLLLQCDWTQLPDAPVSEEMLSDWVTYRQALRDITLQEDPFNIAWPQSPE